MSLFCACGTDDSESYAADGGEPVLLTFSVDVRNSSVTRADDHTWGDNSDANSDNNYPNVIGNSLENNIDLSSLHIMAYYGSDFSFVRDIDILAVAKVEDKVTFTCALPESMPYEAGESYRFMVIANCTNKNYGISYKSDGPDLGDLIYSSTHIQNTIPMWGLKTYTFPAEAEVPADRVLDLGSISMLRAAAKIGVKLSQNVKDEGYSIKEIKLNYANDNGYCVPTNWHHADTYSTESLGHDGAFRPIVNGTLDSDVNAMAHGTETDGYYIYVPETENNSSNPLALAVTLTNSNGDDVEFAYEDGIKFCKYSSDGKPTGDAFNIVRNHFYDYTITDINVGLKLNLNVADWEAEEVWELDFSAPVHSPLLTTVPERIDEDGDGKYEYLDYSTVAAPTTAATLSYNSLNDEQGAFVGYFQMVSPEGATWKPTLSNASAGDYEVRVYAIGETDDVLVTDSAIAADGNKFFKIVVVAKNPNEVGKVVKLGISYTASWNDENTLLMINNGANDGMYYPWEDNNLDDDKDDPDKYWISITQVGSN